MKALRVNVKDLPKPVELYDDSGKTRLYQLQPARKKGLGMTLTGIAEGFKDLFRKK